MMSQNNAFFKNNIPSSESDEGARGYGIVVFEAVTTIPYSGLFTKPSKSSELFEGYFWPERWNIVTIFIFLRQPLLSKQYFPAPSQS